MTDDFATRGGCGGCRGMGAHSPRCHTQPGHLWRKLSDMAEGLGDQIGSNDVELANEAYSLASELRKKISIQYPPLVRDGSPEDGEVCQSCGHGTRSQVHKGTNGKGAIGLCLRMTAVPEGTPGAFFNPIAQSWVVRCECVDFLEGTDDGLHQ